MVPIIHNYIIVSIELGTAEVMSPLLDSISFFFCFYEEKKNQSLIMKKKKIRALLLAGVRTVDADIHSAYYKTTRVFL